MNYKTQFIKIQDLPPADTFLCSAESAYLQTLRAEKRRGDWLGGRFALKVLLARESGLLPVCSLPAAAERPVEMSAAALGVLKNIDVVKLPSGAPQVFIGAVPDARSVSITHSHGWAVAALSAPQTFLGMLGRAQEAWLSLQKPQIVLHSVRFDNQFIFTVAFAPAIAGAKFARI